MKRTNLGIAGIATLAVILAFACQNPFESGLGSKPDILPPGISVTENGVVKSSGYVKGSISITGTCTDDKGVSRVEWQFRDEASGLLSPLATASLNSSATAWTFPVDTTIASSLYVDGMKKFFITVYDGSGKSNETTINLVFDNTVPLAMVQSPASESDAVNGIIPVSGTAYDLEAGIESISYEIRDAGNAVVASGLCTGTSNWFFNLDTKVLTSTAASFSLVISATDRAGNKSSHQYFYPAVFAANGSVLLTAGQLSQIESGTVLGGTTLITPSNITALQKGGQTLIINQESDKPTFEISSPSSGDVIGLNSKIVGVIYDDDAVDTASASSIQFRILQSDGVTERLGWTDISTYPASSVVGSGVSVRFAASLALCTGGDWYVQVRARDIYGTLGTSAAIRFTVDSGIPSAAITTFPMDGAEQRLYYNSAETIAIGGTAFSGGQVDRISVEILGFASTRQVLASFAGQGTTSASWTCNLPLAGVTEGKQTLLVTAYDDSTGSTKAGTGSALIIVDNTLPTASLNSPTAASSVYGTVTLRGSTSDNNSVAKVELLVGKRGISHTGDGTSYVELAGSLYDWSQAFASADFANSLDADVAGTTYDLPLSLRVTDIAHNTSVTTWHLIIDLSLDKPTVSIQTPVADVNVEGAVLVSGTCYDESPGVDKVFMKVAALRDDFTVIGYVNPVTAAAVSSAAAYEVPWGGTGRSYWQIELNGSSQLYDVCQAGAAYAGLATHNGWLLVTVYAQDSNGAQSAASTVRFRLKTGIPSAAITTLPMLGGEKRLYYNNTETIAIGGTASSTASSGCQINSITVEVSGYPASRQTLTGFPGQDTQSATWTCNLSLAGVAAGNQTIVVTAIDLTSGTSNTGTGTAAIIVDNSLPTAGLNNPPDGSTIYGSVTLRGSTSDNNRVSKVELLVGKLGLSHASATDYVEITDNLYDWTQTFISNDFANSTDADVSGSAFDLPIKMRVTDIAQNQSVTTWHLMIDLDRDKPNLTIQTPSADVNTAGTVVVSGSCYDENPGVAKIFMQVAALKDDYSLIGYVNPVTAAAVTSSYSYEVPWQGSGRTYWQMPLNDTGLLYDVCATGAAYAGLGPHHGWLLVTVWPQDGNGKDGNPSTIRFRLDSTIPRISSVVLTLSGTDVPASDYLYAKGIIHVKANLQDDQQVNSIKISFNGGSTYTSNLIGGGKVTGSGASYSLDYDINTVTDTLIPDTLRADGNGLLTIGIKVEDNSTPAPYTSTYFVTLNLDNTAPDHAALAGAAESIGGGTYLKVTSSTAVLEGYSTDTGTVGGVGGVYVYFTNIAGTTVYDPRTGNGVGIGTVTLPTDIYPAGSAGDLSVHYAIYIDSTGEKGLGDATGDLDGFNESLSSGSTYDFGSGSVPAMKWTAVFDSTKFADGAVRVHFVTKDLAGNTSSGTRDCFIANHAPTISKVTLGTDVDGDGNGSGPAAWETAEFTASSTPGYSATNYTVRNYYLRIATSLAAGTLNGAITYTVRYNGGTDVNSGTPTSTTVTLNGSGTFSGYGITDSAAANDRSFTVRATDSVGLYTEVVVNLTMDNVDGVASTIEVLELGKKYSALGAQADITSYGDSVGGTTGAWTGHVEYPGSSYTFDGADADVSGVIKVRGKAYDDQRLQQITAAIPGYDPDGAGAIAAGGEFVIAHWDGTKMVGDSSATPAWSCAIETEPAESLALATGHTVYWTLTWNTADTTSVVQTNLGMRFRAYDAPLNTPASGVGDKTLTVDVVPYITSVSTQAKMTSGGIKDVNIRAASGNYSVKSGADGSFITINGFNLIPTTNGVRLTTAAEKSGLTAGGALAGNALANNAPNATHTSLTVTNASTVSGYLALVCGSAGNYIYALNNVNDGSKAYNKEPDSTFAKNLLWTDDRFINFFAVSSTSYTKGYWPDMIMNADAPMFSYVNLSAASDLQLRRGDPTVAVPNPDPGSLCRGLAFTSASFAQDSDGRYYHMATHNMSNGRLLFFFDSYASNYMTNLGGGYTSYNGAASPYWSGYPGDSTGNTLNNAIDLDPLNYGGATVLDRYRTPKIIAKGSSTATAASAASVYMVYFDDSTKQLLFRSFRVGRLNTLGTTMGSVGGNTVYTNLPNQTAGAGDTTRQIVSEPGSPSPVPVSASQYYDMVVTTDNYVVIVYYDAAASALKLIRSTTAVDGSAPTTAITWSSAYTISSDYVGTYVSMVRDGTNQLHIAAYDAGGADLRYIFIPDYTLTDFTGTGKTEVTVDAAQSIGIWTDIKLVAGVPYISYYNNSENGTHDSIKLAWFKGAAPSAGARPTAGVDGSGNVTGNWETLTVPVNTVPLGSLPQFRKVNIGIRTDGTPLVSYLGDQIEYVRMYPSL